MKKKYNVAIVGATGMVGQTLISILEETNFPIHQLHAFASSKSVGTTLHLHGIPIKVEELRESSFERSIDIAFFSAGGEISKIFAPIAASHGVLVIDNSSYFRQFETIPLIVPEVNIQDAFSHAQIIANPNCSTIQSVIPLHALREFGIKEVSYTTYQAVSGSGFKGISDLTRDPSTPLHCYPKEIKGNVLPLIDVLLDHGFTKEEIKMREETRKILHLPNVPVSATCVRVPVENGHSVSLVVTLDQIITEQQFTEALSKQPGLMIASDKIPTPLDVIGQDSVVVGRIRQDLDVKNRWHVWVVADNVRKGAATNAVQIALKLIEEEII